MQFTLNLNLFPQLESVYFCPDMKGEDCWYVSKEEAFEVGRNEVDLIGSYRKPKPGMIHHVLRGFRDEGIEIDDCWMIGDRPQDDEQCAVNAGINFFLADVWRDRFRPRMFEHQITPAQLQFLEGVKLGGG